MNSKTNLIVLLAYTMLLSTISLAQVKVGNNPDAIDATSLLELESASKVLVITRVTEAEMDALNPLPGAIVNVFFPTMGILGKICVMQPM
jgi:hypothetical protein